MQVRWQGQGRLAVHLWPTTPGDEAWTVPPTLFSIQAVEPAKGPRDWYAGDADIEAGAWLSDQALRRRRPSD